jgi:deoxyribonuclease V
MWPATPDELIQEQLTLARAEPPPWEPPEHPIVGACVIRFPRGQAGRGARGDPAWATAAALDGTRVVAEAAVRSAAGAPYEPGLLALREGPPLESAVRELAVVPDVVLVDAGSRDHPRRAGLALQLGAVLELPTIGVTHRPLQAVGEWPPDERGATAPLTLDGELVAVWLRTQERARPLVVHGGWRVGLDVAAALVLGVSGAYRTPEPLRHARQLAREARGVPPESYA